MNSQNRTRQEEVMAVTISKQPAFRRTAMARHSCRTGWLAVMLLCGVVGCAGLEQNLLTRRATVVEKWPITTSQPSDSDRFEIVVQVRRLPELTTRSEVTIAAVESFLIENKQCLHAANRYSDGWRCLSPSPRACRTLSGHREIRRRISCFLPGSRRINI